MTWYLLALMAAFVLGIYSIIEKRGLRKADPLSFLIISSFIISLLSFPVFFTRDVFIFTNIEMLLIFIKSFFAALFFLFIAKALDKMEISEFAPFLSFSPLIVLILSFIFLGEKISTLAFIGFILIISGAYILELTDGLFSPIRAIRKSQNIHYIFLGIFFGAICAIIDRYLLSRGPDLLSFFVLNNIFITFAFGIISFFRKENLRNIKTSFKYVLPWALLGAIFYMSGDLLYFKALTIPSAMIALVIAIKRLSILVSTIVGGEIFHENNLFRKGLAAIIMLAGVFLVII